MFLNKLRQYAFSDGVLLLCLLLVGGFHEYIACLLGAVLGGYFLIRLLKGKSLKIHTDLLTCAVIAVCLGYGLTCLWAVDKGMAPIGFLKFLPVLLYLVCLQQEEGTGKVLAVLPCFGAAMAVISAIGMQLPGGQRWFAVAGRLAGFFQYPNTFAVFLLVCQLLLVKKPDKKLRDYLILVLLVAGLLYTGSRTAFVVAVLANLGMLLVLGKKRVRLVLLIGCGIAAVAAGVLMLTEGTVLHRYLNISLTESTFVGRLLYWQDALKLLIKYPMGMGFMGYYYAQQGVQTGVYSVLYVHNDFLQLLLDVGLIPGGLFLTAVIAWLCKKEVPAADKVIVGALCLHSLFDFNLQFTGMFFLLLLLMQTPAKTREFACKRRLPWQLAAGVLAAVSLYMAVPLALAHWEQRTLSESLYPWNTQNKLALLEQTTDYESALPLAEEILALNPHYFAPYTIRAGYCYTKGDYSGVIRNQRQAIACNPFSHTEYENYCKMLLNGISQYQKEGKDNSAAACAQELLNVAQQLQDNEKRLSVLGKKIKDQPVTELSKEIQEYIDKLKEVQNAAK